NISLTVTDFPGRIMLNQNTTLYVTGGSLNTTTAAPTDYTIGGQGALEIGSLSGSPRGSFNWISGTIAGVANGPQIQQSNLVVLAGGELKISSSSDLTKDARLARNLQINTGGKVSFLRGPLYRGMKP